MYKFEVFMAFKLAYILKNEIWFGERARTSKTLIMKGWKTVIIKNFDPRKFPATHHFTVFLS